MTKNVPIITFHLGNPFFLFYALSQARHVDPNQEIILIGDSSNAHYPFVEHVMADEYLGNTPEFRSVYKHHSSHREEFERICFERWFITREFMQREGIEEAFIIDSDVMMYSPVPEIIAPFQEADLACLRLRSFGTLYIRTMSALDAFCDLIMNSYTEGYDALITKHRESGISDMTLVRDFVEQTEYRIEDLCTVHNGAVVDNSMSHPWVFEGEKELKKIYWQDQLPYGRLENAQELIRFHVLHFHGVQGKKLLPQAWSLRSAHWNPENLEQHRL